MNILMQLIGIIRNINFRIQNLLIPNMFWNHLQIMVHPVLKHGIVQLMMDIVILNMIPSLGRRTLKILKMDKHIIRELFQQLNSIKLLI